MATDGAGFAGFRTETESNLSDYHSLQLLCRGQGDYFGYKVVLRHRGENSQLFPSYEHMFQVIEISLTFVVAILLKYFSIIVWTDLYTYFEPSSTISCMT